MMNILSLIQEFTFIPAEARQEIAISGLEEILGNKESPFHRQQKKQPEATAQICSILSTTHLSRTKGPREENLMKALGYNKFALELLDPEFDFEFITTLLNNQTIIYKRMKKFEDSLKSFEQLLKIRTQEKTPLEWGLSNINMGNLYVDEEFLKKCENVSVNFEKAIQCYENALKVLKKDVQSVQWTIAMMSLGYAMYLSSDDMKMLGDALNRLDEALGSIKKEVRKGEYGVIQYHRCCCLWKIFGANKSKDVLNAALQAVDEANSVMQKENVKLTDLKKLIQTALEK
jgi:tetratricopeptide (TPR) repeat protein